MKKLTALDILTASPIVPVIAIKQIKDAIPLAHALVAGGVKVLEVTLRTDCALDAIGMMQNAVPEAIVGAGTVTSREQYQQAVAAGARFVITPGLTEDLLKTSQTYDIPFIPGIATPSELMLAKQYGLRYLKFFPAEINGGIKALQAFNGPFPEIKFCPTGGINEKTTNNIWHSIMYFVSVALGLFPIKPSNKEILLTLHSWHSLQLMH